MRAFPGFDSERVGNAGVRFVRNRWTEWFAGGQDAIMVEVAVVIVGEEEEW